MFQDNASSKKAEGDSYARQGNYEKAILCYDKACFVNPDDFTIYAARGSAYTKLCDFKVELDTYFGLLNLDV